MDRSQPMPDVPSPVRSCVAALALCTVASVTYGATRLVQAVLPDSSPYPAVDSATDAGFSLFAALGYGAASYGMVTGRWAARQLGLLVSGAFLPYGALIALLAFVNLLGYDWDSRLRTALLGANCIALTAAIAGAVLGLATLLRRDVADHVVRRLPPVPAARIGRMTRRARVLLVTVALTLTGVIQWLATLAFAGENPPSRAGAAIGLLLVFLLMLVPALLCVGSAALLPRYPGARRAGLVGLWMSALLGVPLMVLLASFMTTTGSGTRDAGDTAWVLGTAVALLCELVGFGCVVGAVLLVNHPALRARLTAAPPPPAAPRPAAGPPLRR